MGAAYGRPNHILWPPVSSHVKAQKRSLHLCVGKPVGQLRSSSAGLLSAPSLQGPDGRLKRSQLFSVVAPTWWNDLKDKAITTAETLSTFRRRLKTHLFQ